jgi:hypothetical protein
MLDKSMLIVDAELIGKIDANRGDFSRSEFINFLIDRILDESDKPANGKTEWITREEFQESQQSIKELLRSFLEFFVSYEMEVGKKPENSDLDDLLKKFWKKDNPGKSRPF